MGVTLSTVTSLSGLGDLLMFLCIVWKIESVKYDDVVLWGLTH